MTRPCRCDSAGIFLSALFGFPLTSTSPIAASSGLNLLRHLFAPPFISSRHPDSAHPFLCLEKAM